MKLKTTDMEKISRRICEKKNCGDKSSAILNSKFLCEDHFREIHPGKESGLLRLLLKLL